MLTEENLNKITTATNLIDIITKTGLRVLDKFPTAEIGYEGFIFLSLVERFTFHLEGANILLKTFKINTRVESAIGIILRACLLDFMTASYLSTYMSDIKSPTDEVPKKELEKQIDILMTDQVHNTIKYLKMGKDCGLINNADYEAAISTTWQNYNSLFADEPGDFKHPEKNLLQKDFISPKKLFTRIHHHPLTKKLSPVYDLYTYYSKYEHFGLMTHLMQRADTNDQFNRILAATKYTLKGLGASLMWLNYPQGKLADDFNTFENISEEFNLL